MAEERGGIFSSLAEMVRDFAAATAEFIWGEYDNRTLGLKIWLGIDRQGSAPPESYKVINTFAADIERSTELHAEIKEEFDDFSKQPLLMAGFLHLWGTIQLASAKWGAWSRAVGALRSRRVNADIRPDLLDARTLTDYLWRFPGDGADTARLIDDTGLSNDQQVMLLRLARQYPSLGEILALRNRDELNDGEAIQMMIEQGVDAADASSLLTLRWYRPSAQEITSLAGREAYEEDQIDEFGLADGLPERAVEEGRLSGVPRDIIRQNWVAHWQNPSLSQVFQMIHRKAKRPGGRTWEPADLDEYLKLADINPWWRESLVDITYTPISRVDIRRFYARGIIETFKEVEDRYEALGYSPADATVLAQFAQRERDTFGRDLSRTQLERLYRLGGITPDELKTRFLLLDYDDTEATYIVDLLIASIAGDRLESDIERVRLDYVTRDSDEGEVSRDLTTLGLVTEAVTAYVDLWRNERVTERQLPTKAELVKWLDATQISVGYFEETMRLRGYTDYDIGLYRDGS